MNISEQKAYNWLKGQGYKDIVFRRHLTPDFVTDNGGLYEVKKSRNKTIWFSAGQYNTLRNMDGVKVLVFDDGDEPQVEIPFDELKDGKTLWHNYRIYGGTQADCQLVNISLGRDLWRKVKAQAALEGKSITQWLTEILKNKLGGQ